VKRRSILFGLLAAPFAGVLPKDKAATPQTIRIVKWKSVPFKWEEIDTTLDKAAIAKWNEALLHNYMNSHYIPFGDKTPPT